MSLRERIASEIGATGPLNVARYMDLCLNDPQGGYYATRPRLGADGDFITAPHVSQMFGELLGAWAAEVWAALGRPARVRLMEIGPGEGVMIGDVLRAAAHAAGFLAACEVWLIEPSAPLAAAQRQRLGCAGGLRWARSLAEIPLDAPVILLANEVLDCLPVRQAVATACGWRERRVGLSPGGALAFTLGDPVVPPAAPALAKAGEIVEWSEDLAAFGRAVGELVAASGGAALFVDYGRAGDGLGDTLQALEGHARRDPLATPGEADLTVHVDFPAFLAAARTAGAATSGIVNQADFLRALGIELRADRLARARPDKADVILRQLRRLIAPDQMGVLFKVACVHAPGLAIPALASDA
jgi:SAM-dependent MidA family methyltransferase